MRLQHPLASVAPTVGAAALSVLAGADTHFTVPRIQTLLPQQASLPGLRKALAALVMQGIVLEAIVGNTRSYRLNREHILAEPLIAMTRSRELLLGRMREHIASWSVQPTAVTIFGSAARGDMDDDSDIDLLVILPDEEQHDSIHDQIDRLAADITTWTGNDTRPLVYRECEIAPSPIFNSIMDEGTNVAGDANWLRRRLRRPSDAS